jgi:hypothetical protein
MGRAKVSVNGSQAPKSFTITIGEQSFAPVSYQTFRVGPFQATVHFEEGASEEQIEQELDSAFNLLLEWSRKEYKRALEAHLACIEHNAAKVSERKRNRG